MSTLKMSFHCLLDPIIFFMNSVVCLIFASLNRISFFLFFAGIASGESRNAVKIPLTSTMPKLLIAWVALKTSMPKVKIVVSIASVIASSDVSGVPRGLLKNSV